ncbi:diguanylate cyclase [Microbacterium sp. 1P10UB]|uniref:bifunctional diguanylate cyclase/phosphodiesterase n=1 Tax=unclassified Microbacterium TaxID=2609290 RepID=UPI0039A2871A
MTDQRVHLTLSDSEIRRLEDCAREPIRTPGSIQAHGALIAVEPASHRIVAVSENCAELLGIPGPLLGQPLSVAVDAELEQTLQAMLEDARAANPITFETDEGLFDAIVQPASGLILLELEPRLQLPLQQLASGLYAISHRLAAIDDVDRLLKETARELRALTGFDRVMVYRFHPDDHGEVVAEERAEDMEPFEGLHFPASDIPAQARQLYITKLSRAIVGTSGESSPIITVGGEYAPSALDLSPAELRSVSPHHLEFMRNMGQESTVSFSMVTDGVLTGMITCAHRTRRQLPFIQRRGIEVLANQIALQVRALEQVRRLNRQVQLRRTRAELLVQIAASDDIAGTLVRGEVTVRDLISCDGVAVRINGRTRVLGDTPPTAELEALRTRLDESREYSFIASDALGLDRPYFAEVAPSVTGVLMVPVGGAGDYIAFFRNEVLLDIEWLGDQTNANRLTPLSPRMSFSAWTDSVAGTAPAWGELAAEAIDLARDLESALLRRVESELAHLAMYDPLTGLSNRRGMLDRLELALRDDAPSWILTVLFVDLDGFKSVNDTFGHDVGDALISLIGERIVSVVRAQDTVARLGGDEFVIVCQHMDREAAEHVAGRIIEAIAEPATIDGSVVTVTASVGIAVTDRPIEAAELLRHADEAMYRAKVSGKNRVSA